MKRLLGAVAVSAFLCGTPPLVSAFDVRVDSETIFRWFERDDAAGKSNQVLPVYEYLRLDLGQVDDKGFSVHAYGWGRYDFGDDFFEDRSEAEILYGYLQYTHDAHNLSAWAGRQFVFEGVSNINVDGVGVASDLGRWFSASLYLGQPVELEETGGRSGDLVWGGRVSHHLGTNYELGLSYKRVENDSAKQEEVLGVDTSVNLAAPVSLHGLSAYNVDEQEWQEHSYEVLARLAGFRLRPFLQYFDYDAYFDTGVDTGSPFRFLAASTEELTLYGADLGWDPTDWVELEFKLNRYDYDVRNDNALYYAALLTLHAQNPLTQVGGEAGFMDGDTKDTRYTLWRGYGYWDLPGFFLSGDAVFLNYDEDILGEDTALFVSLGAGHRFLEDKLELRLSGDYSSDPYFDEDWRAMLALQYRLDK